MTHSKDLSRHAGRLTCFLIVGLLAGASLSAPLFSQESDSVPASTFTAATYNVKNLFDEHDDPYANDEETVPKTKPKEEVEALARVIRSMDADVLALQEVESRGVLRKFKNGLLKGMEYRDPVLLEGNDMRGIDVAVLSKLPVGQVTSYRHLTFDKDDGKSTRFSRDLLKVRVRPTRDFWFDLYVVHLKSGSGAGDRKKRAAEARKVREIIEEELGREAGYRFIVIGDFNDGRESLTVKTIAGEGENELFCPSDFLPEEERYTFFREGKKARVDYIFCSASMKDLYVAGSVRVIGGEDAARASDHRPLIASFEIPAGK
jgi:endonuclease/exonuclease/phosphatase family metal-dependent hydrolase